MVIYPLVLIADVATDVCSPRARLRFASSTRIVVMCRMIEKGPHLLTCTRQSPLERLMLALPLVAERARARVPADMVEFVTGRW